METINLGGHSGCKILLYEKISRPKMNTILQETKFIINKYNIKANKKQKKILQKCHIMSKNVNNKYKKIRTLPTKTIKDCGGVLKNLVVFDNKNIRFIGLP